MDEIVLNLDFAPTFLDYAGIDIPKSLQGKSFRNIVNKITAKIVGLANKKTCQINELKIEDLNLIEKNLGENLKKFLKIENSINYKKSIGSTSPK